ncbi:ABC transporter permease [Vibrio vulnificus]|uniref:ABC transporter permease n=1 Tax=Vibrio vulnificus TaxID=672 RepID=UPI000DAC7490|nr:ABC transporter permease [Vibrio vulnificus]EGR0056435.1 ABC transporter permease [Vibrio vulnificus]MCU8114285.1 ABC transporter permease [Vibrio vulnificus]MCU8306055.1 ABC transporter permease [Vibrio vulnificus]MDK2682668.1 ABC transporter permease [Vibrio vulnificus]RAH32579.1 ABC transporter permease [Vibrio vulnificus]
MKPHFSQLHVLRHDKWLLSCLTWIPILLALLIWGVFSAGIARDLPIGVVDNAHSTLSRKLTQMLDASSTMSVDYQFSDVLQAKNAMIEGKVYAYVIIPDHFDRDIYLQRAPQVSVFYNSQYILIGRLINSAVVQAQGFFNAGLETMKSLSHGNSTVQGALGNAVTISTQISPLFNQNTNYAQFLVSAVVPAIWQIMIVVCSILILAANLRVYARKPEHLDRWLGTQPFKVISKTLAAYLPIFLLHGFAFLFWFYFMLDWPFQGHLLPIMIAQLATTIACMIMGAFFFFMTLDAARAMSFAGAFTAPSFAFMGITFPVSDMGSLAQFWRSLLPISHYIEVQVAQASYGASALTSLTHLLPMVGYVLPAFLAVALAKRHLKKTEATNVPV